MNKVLLFISIVVLLSSCVLNQTGSIQRCAPGLESFLLEVKDFPANWHKGTAEENDEFSQRAIEHCIVSFTVVDGIPFQEIYQFEKEHDATVDYEALEKDFFWEKIEAIPAPSYNSKTSNQFTMKCYSYHDIPMCTMLGRYNNFIVHFHTHYRPEFMTEDDLVKILKAIDNKME